MRIFQEQFENEKDWRKRAFIMEFFHLGMIAQGKWNLSKTAEYFEKSIGLVSENIMLARNLHTDKLLDECKSRNEAVRYLRANGRS